MVEAKGEMTLLQNFKHRVRFDDRCRESKKIMQVHPFKVPIIVERSAGEKTLPALERCKFLVPRVFTAGQLIEIIRRRLQLNDSQTLFLLVNERNIVGCTTIMGELYKNEVDDDGFLYIVYASQEVFGSC